MNLFVRAPGDLLYFLAVVAISQAGFFMALGQRLRRPMDRVFQRYTLAALGIVLAWASLMIGALYALLTHQDPTAILPPMERAAQVLSILLIGWAFLTADHGLWGRWPTFVLMVLIVIVVIGYVVTGLRWPEIVETTDFNLSIF